MKESYFMGIDTGTNSSKGVLINSHGEIIAEQTLKQSEQVHLVPTAYLSTISVDLYAKLSYMVLMHVQPMR